MSDGSLGARAVAYESRTIFITADGLLYGTGDNIAGGLGIPADYARYPIFSKATPIPLATPAHMVGMDSGLLLVLGVDGQLYGAGDAARPLYPAPAIDAFADMGRLRPLPLPEPCRRLYDGFFVLAESGRLYALYIRPYYDAVTERFGLPSRAYNQGRLAGDADEPETAEHGGADTEVSLPTGLYPLVLPAPLSDVYPSSMHTIVQDEYGRFYGAGSNTIGALGVGDCYRHEGFAPVGRWPEE